MSIYFTNRYCTSKAYITADGFDGTYVINKNINKNRSKDVYITVFNDKKKDRFIEYNSNNHILAKGNCVKTSHNYAVLEKDGSFIASIIYSKEKYYFVNNNKSEEIHKVSSDPIVP